MDVCPGGARAALAGLRRHAGEERSRINTMLGRRGRARKPSARSREGEGEEERSRSRSLSRSLSRSRSRSRSASPNTTHRRRGQIHPMEKEEAAGVFGVLFPAWSATARPASTSADSATQANGASAEAAAQPATVTFEGFTWSPSYSRKKCGPIPPVGVRSSFEQFNPVDEVWARCIGVDRGGLYEDMEVEDLVRFPSP